MNNIILNSPDSASLTFGVTPTADAAFRFHTLLDQAFAREQTDRAFALKPAWHDIDVLDELAQIGALDVTLLSIPAYAKVQDRYRLLSCGARFGSGFGAMVVTYNPLERVTLGSVRIGVPGVRNSGFLALSCFLPDTFEYALIADDQLRESVVRGEVDAALLTGEEQLTHQALGLYNVVDLGAWWQEQTNLLFPLEALAVRRDIPAEKQAQIVQAVESSYEHSRVHPHTSLDYAFSFARKMDRETTAAYVGMYVTEQSRRLDETGRASIHSFLEYGARKGHIPSVTELDILVSA